MDPKIFLREISHHFKDSKDFKTNHRVNHLDKMEDNLDFRIILTRIFRNKIKDNKDTMINQTVNKIDKIVIKINLLDIKRAKEMDNLDHTAIQLMDNHAIRTMENFSIKRDQNAPTIKI
jgi:hypothetical protein